jgi:hypothetical protein
MGYITYRPDKIADNPLVTIHGQHEDHLTITRICEMSSDMAKYWHADYDVMNSCWYWISTQIDRQLGIPVPANILLALRDVGQVFLKYEAMQVPDIVIRHRNIEYSFNFPNYGFAIYPHYSRDAEYDKHPYINDTDLTVIEVFEAIAKIDF